MRNHACLHYKRYLFVICGCKCDPLISMYKQMVRGRGMQQNFLYALKKFGITMPRVLGSLHAHSQMWAPNS